MRAVARTKVCRINLLIKIAFLIQSLLVISFKDRPKILFLMGTPKNRNLSHNSDTELSAPNHDFLTQADGDLQTLEPVVTSPIYTESREELK